MKTYKSIYQIIKDEINKQKNKKGNLSGSLLSDKISSLDSSTAEVLSSLTNSCSKFIKNRIIEGLDISATSPESKTIIISPGYGIVKGKEFRLISEKRIDINIPSANPIIYIHLNNTGGIYQSNIKDSASLVIGKIVCIPNASNDIYNTYEEARNAGYGAYIVSAKDLLFDNEASIDDDTIQALRNNMSKLLADNLIGNIRLSENLKITNSFGTLYMDSQSLKFYNRDGQELARYTSVDARIGNIIIEPDRLRTGNFVSGKSGFEIKDDGNVEFNNIIARGTIYADIGEIGGWTIGTNKLYSTNIEIDSLNERINLGNKIYIDGLNKYISSVPFQPGNTGWRIDESTAEFNNAVIRGSLRSSLFIKDEIHATSGTMILTSALIIAEDFTTPSSTETNFDIKCKNPETGVAQVFNINDILRCKSIYSSSIGDVWCQVVSYSDNGDGTATYTVTLKSGTNITIQAGSTIVSYGQSTDNKILLTSDLSNAPYLDIFNTGSTPWDGITTKLRLGNLNNFTDPDFGTLSGFGLFADNVYLKGYIKISGGSGISNLSDANLDNISDGTTYKRTTQDEKTGAGYAYNALNSDYSLKTKVLPGDDIITPSGSGLFLGADYLGYYDGSEWKAFIDNNGNFTFKGDSNNYISWNGTNLNIRGGLLLQSSYSSSPSQSGARVDILPSDDTNMGLRVVDSSGNNVFQAYVAGTGDPGEGDVIIGDYSSSGLKWDNSLSKFLIKGAKITSADINEYFVLDLQDESTSSIQFKETAFSGKGLVVGNSYDFGLGYNYPTIIFYDQGSQTSQRIRIDYFGFNIFSGSSSETNYYANYMKMYEKKTISTIDYEISTIFRVDPTWNSSLVETQIFDNSQIYTNFPSIRRLRLGKSTYSWTEIQLDASSFIFFNTNRLKFYDGGSSQLKIESDNSASDREFVFDNPGTGKAKIKADDFLLGVNKTRYYSFGPADAIPINNSISYYLERSYGFIAYYVLVNGTTTTSSYSIPLTFPHGAILKKIRIYWYRDDSSASGSASLRYVPSYGGTMIGIASANSNSTAGNHYVESTISTVNNYHIVDNTNSMYYIEITLTNNTSIDDVRFWGGYIEYEITEPMP